MYEYFHYIDVIRRPDGSLRPWEEHYRLAKMEAYLDNSGDMINHALRDVLVEYEKRSAIQTGLQKKCI
jgi:hypothetical protein